MVGIVINVTPEFSTTMHLGMGGWRSVVYLFAWRNSCDGFPRSISSFKFSIFLCGLEIMERRKTSPSGPGRRRSVEWWGMSSLVTSSGTHHLLVTSSGARHLLVTGDRARHLLVTGDGIHHLLVIGNKFR